MAGADVANKTLHAAHLGGGIPSAAAAVSGDVGCPVDGHWQPGPCSVLHQVFSNPFAFGVADTKLVEVIQRSVLADGARTGNAVAGDNRHCGDVVERDAMSGCQAQQLIGAIDVGRLHLRIGVDEVDRSARVHHEAGAFGQPLEVDLVQPEAGLGEVPEDDVDAGFILRTNVRGRTVGLPSSTQSLACSFL